MERKPQSGRSTSSADRRARISLARALSKLGYTSRSQARPLIEAGSVAVNGKTVKDPEHRIDIERDRVAVNGQVVTLEPYVYLLLNKPAGVVTTRSDEKERTTVFDLLSDADLPHLSAVGRLDLESEGLLLFTNDTRWADHIASPKGHVDKVYHVQIEGSPDMQLMEAMQKGVSDRGDLLKAKSVSLLEMTDTDAWLEVVLDEGKNRHIRRMLTALEVRVLRLKRVAIGSVKLGKLKPGEFRNLTEAEVKALTR
jgi:23S rRNA pseudouridine2605 synthase